MYLFTSVLESAARRVCEAATSRFSSCDKIGRSNVGSTKDAAGPLFSIFHGRFDDFFLISQKSTNIFAFQLFS